MKKRTKIITGIILLVLIVAIGYLLMYQKSVQNYRDKVNSITYDNIDANGVADGVYTGEMNVDFIYAKVDVTIANGIIADIKIIEHKNDRGASAEPVINSIITQQKIDVDIVSGATNSSKVLKKAVDNAISNAQKLK